MIFKGEFLFQRKVGKLVNLLTSLYPGFLQQDANNNIYHLIGVVQKIKQMSMSSNTACIKYSAMFVFIMLESYNNHMI